MDSKKYILGLGNPIIDISAEANEETLKKYILESNDFSSDPDLDPCVRVVELGSSSIDVLIVAYSEPVGFADFNLIKENLIFNIMSIVKDNNSEFAFPSTSVYIEKNQLQSQN